MRLTRVDHLPSRAAAPGESLASLTWPGSRSANRANYHSRNHATQIAIEITSEPDWRRVSSMIVYETSRRRDGL